MNKLMFRLKKKLVNKKANTRRIKYESLLEENKTKNDEIIKLLYERNELKDKLEDYEKQLLLYKNRIEVFEEKIEKLEEKNAELLHIIEAKTVKKRVKKDA